MMEAERPPLPPFTTVEAAVPKVRFAEDAWNTRDPRHVARWPRHQAATGAIAPNSSRAAKRRPLLDMLRERYSDLWAERGSV
jgi:nuclear transport factor 2 (NTF2) superfamily protein